MKLARYALVLGLTAALGGCAHEYPKLESSSVVTMEGSDVKQFQAPSDGQLFIYDQANDDRVYSGLIHKGELVEIDPTTRNVRVNGLLANPKPLFGGNALKIDFDPNP